MARMGRNERLAKRANAQRAETRRKTIGQNMRVMSDLIEERHYHNADAYRLSCGERTISFVGQLPGGMTKMLVTSKRYNVWSNK